jgi:hypothetical protein
MTISNHGGADIGKDHGGEFIGAATPAVNIGVALTYRYSGGRESSADDPEGGTEAHIESFTPLARSDRPMAAHALHSG